MYEWLEEEIRSFKTPHFCKVDGPVPADLRQAIEESDSPVPPSYKAFVLQFGNVQLYRHGLCYDVEVYAGPRLAESEDGEPLVNFGRTGLGLAYFKEALLVPGGESPVFEWHGPEFAWSRTAEGFDEWLRKSCTDAREQFSQQEWESILAGPAPFTERELAIVEARKLFRWRVVGIADNGDLRFEVHNGSGMLLPYLSVGIRYKSGRRFGGVMLPVSGIRPGQTALVEVDCYKERHAPDKIEAFQEPDPEPALRDLYWEFK